MKKDLMEIAVIEPSSIIREGLISILQKIEPRPDIMIFKDLLDPLENSNPLPEFILLNPAMIINRIKEFRNIKKANQNSKWIGIVYNNFDANILNEFDELINVSDEENKVEYIINILHTEKTGSPANETIQEYLSERETEVLKLLVEGYQNKEIAEKLNISTHTVVSHRKNISHKTGIKSVAGLTIYSVVNNIISLETSKFRS